MAETIQIINESKSIYLIPSKEPEAIASSLALFYTLKELGKNVNLVIDEFPENLKFLSPSLDFISYPKNFVISVPSTTAQISQIYYEKNAEGLKIHLNLDSGNIKKDDLSFYFAEPKPDLIITVGIKDYTKELSEKLNSFGFLLESPILNVDGGIAAQTENKKFGKINIIENTSLSEAVLNLIKDIHSNQSRQEVLNCLLAGIIIYTKNLKENISGEILQAAGALMKNGADLKLIINNLNP